MALEITSMPFAIVNDEALAQVEIFVIDDRIDGQDDENFNGARMKFSELHTFLQNKILGTDSVLTIKIKDGNVTADKLATDVVMRLAIVGEIKQWPGITPPSGWLELDGSSLQKSDYPNLWAFADAEIQAGSSFFEEDSSTHFSLPEVIDALPPDGVIVKSIIYAG